MKGFSLVELLVVIALSIMLSAIAFVYSNTGKKAIALSVETAKVAETILRAKNLAVATYNTSPQTCGYGVYLNIAANKYSIFAFNPDPSKYGADIPPCPGLASTTAAGITIGGQNTEVFQYSPETWGIGVGSDVKLRSGSGNLIAVVFYPPAPATLMSQDGNTFTSETSLVRLAVPGTSLSSTISVNPAGQVNW